MADAGVKTYPRAYGEPPFPAVICKDTDIGRQIAGRRKDIGKRRKRVGGKPEASGKIIA